MAPKPSEAQLRKKLEKEQVRKRVLELAQDGKLSLAAIAAHPDVKMSKGGVQGIIKRCKDRNDVVAKKNPGRPSKLTKRCALSVSDPFHIKLTYISSLLASFGTWST